MLMERAVLLSTVPVGGIPEGYERVYLGNEFCERNLPTPEELSRGLEAAKDASIPLTLVTPYLTDTGLSKVRKLLDVLPSGSEVVFNDWGLLDSILERRLVPVAGRLLIKIRRDPRVEAVDLEDEHMAGYLRGSNLSQPSFQRFLLDRGIFRAELDNVQQGWDLDLPPALRTSLYYPFVHASVTRRCSLLFGGQGDQPGAPDGSCVKRCDDYVLRSSIPVTLGEEEERADQYLHGGALYYRNDNMPSPADLKRWNTDRLVVMTEQGA